MKTLLLTLSLATAAVGTSQAEFFRPSIVPQTTVLGAVAGALIGGHNNDRWVQGAVIGAAAGALVGTAVDNSGRSYSEREIRPGYDYGREYAPEVVYVDPAPRVVYVNPAPRVVYVTPRPVYVQRPVVYIGNDRNYNHHRGYDRGYDRRHDRRDDRRW
ncbi:MAG: YMGG-like glycine zipper-containing protein [Opitutus sp.]